MKSWGSVLSILILPAALQTDLDLDPGEPNQQGSGSKTLFSQNLMKMSSSRERVSVKMVAKKEDGTVVKKLFKPIEDSVKEGMDSRNNIFVLSKNKVIMSIF
jgi:hypothetical protein